MDIYVYSDESGVFDKAHNDFFVFGGIVFLSKEDRDLAARRYSRAERTIRAKERFTKDKELKASVISNSSKGKLYRSMNSYEKFAVVIKQHNVLDRIFQSKKDKQRYLDYAFKIGVKNKLQHLINNKIIDPTEVSNITFYVDEHTTATNGIYELREALEQEFKHGTYNMNFDHHFPPIFPTLNSIQLNFCNSASKTLIRTADIIANKVYYHAVNNSLSTIHDINNLYVTYLPRPW